MTKEPEDEIAEEIRRRRQRHAEAFDYDLDRITKDLQRREKESTARIVELPSRKPKETTKRPST